MKKTEAMQVLSVETYAEMATALGLTTPQAVIAWPDRLKEHQVDRVLGAALRRGTLSLSDVARYSGVTSRNAA